MTTDFWKVVALVVGLTPDIADADCLNRTSLDRGVQITFWDGSTATIKRVDGNLLAYFNSNSSADRQHQLSYFGVYDVANDEQFDSVPPEPMIGLEFEVKVTGSSESATRLRDLTYEFRQGSGREFEGCEYETIEVWFDEDWGDGIRVRKNGRDYFPQLGFGLWQTPIASMKEVQ
jgi:hypothetical protein